MSEENYLTYDESIPPLLGRGFQLHLRPAARLTWIGAGWAALCGIVAAGTLYPSVDTLVRVPLALVLADSVLGTVWTAMLGIPHPPRSEASDADPLPVARVSPESPVTATPCSTDDEAPENPAAVEDFGLEAAPTSFWASIAAGLDERPTRLLIDRRLPQLVTKLGTPLDLVRAWYSGLSAAYRRRALEVGLLYGLALVLGLALGRSVAVIVASGLLLPLIVWFALGGYPLRDGWTRAVLEIGLPWTIGLSTFSAVPAINLDGLAGLALSTVFWAGEHAAALAVGLLFVVAYYGELTLDQPLRGIQRRSLVILPQAVVVVLLIAWRQPILAGAAAILVLAQMLFQPYLARRQMRWYLRTTQWMFMGMMLIAAIGVAVSRL